MMLLVCSREHHGAKSPAEPQARLPRQPLRTQHHARGRRQADARGRAAILFWIQRTTVRTVLVRVSPSLVCFIWLFALITGNASSCVARRCAYVA